MVLIIVLPNQCFRPWGILVKHLFLHFLKEMLF